MVDTSDRTILPWSELTAMAATESSTRAASEVLAALRRSVGGAAPMSLGSLLDLVESGRLTELAQPLFPTATNRELPGRLAPRLAPVMALAALRRGAAEWRHSWSRGPELVGIGDEEQLDLAEVARLAVEPHTVARARRRLIALGVDLAVALDTGPPEATSPEVQILGGFANIKVDKVAHDLLVLDTGLILIADPPQATTGRERLARLIESMTPTELTERHRFIRYADIGRARVIRNLPVHAEIELADGQQLSLVQAWTTPQLTKQSDEVLVRMLTSKPSSGAGHGPSTSRGPATPGDNRRREPDTRQEHAASATPGRVQATQQEPDQRRHRQRTPSPPT